MSPLRRILFFAVGVLVGLVIVNRLVRGHSRETKDRARIADTRAIPGMLLDYAQHGQAIYDDKGVVESATGPGAEGFARTRRILTGGRARYDDAGNRLPDEWLVITEYYAEPGEPGPRSRVARYDFAYADRVRFEVRSASDRPAAYAALKPLGAHLRTDAGSETKVTASLPRPKLATVDEALAILKTVPGVVAASPVKLDWKSQLIK